MPTELPQIQTPAPVTEGTQPTDSNTVQTTPTVREADAGDSAARGLLLAETLRDCITSLPQSLLSPSPEVIARSERSRSLKRDQAGFGDDQESEVLRLAKLLRSSLYAVARQVDPSEGYQDSLSEKVASWASRRYGHAKSPEVNDSPNLESGRVYSKPHKTSNVTLGRIMGNTSGPPWGNDAMKLLCEALYTESFDEKHTAHLRSIAASYDGVAHCDQSVKTSDDYINRICCLVGFLEQSKGNGTMAEFLNLGRAQVPGWPLAPTTFIQEHLFTDNVVKILCPSMDYMKALVKFSTNRAAIRNRIDNFKPESCLFGLYSLHCWQLLLRPSKIITKRGSN
ncbi:hypothetical protein B0H11DRAFT_1919957 [Mycena galericulata]|nr:hypothetical protein B0H11DRAFT_1919957 [Mycena galericulata]